MNNPRKTFQCPKPVRYNIGKKYNPCATVKKHPPVNTVQRVRRKKDNEDEHPYPILM